MNGVLLVECATWLIISARFNSVMIKIKRLDDNLNIEGKRVLLRVDFNVPINDGAITENSRIEKVLPTINFLIKKKSKNNNYCTSWKTQRKNRSWINSKANCKKTI